MALSQLGQVLIHVPEDSSGLWIDKAVADALNRNEFDALRDGYVVGEFNSRGVYLLDPTGKPEFNLAEKYLKKAEALRLEGYPRFASSMGRLADDYRRQAERLVANRRNGDS